MCWGRFPKFTVACRAGWEPRFPDAWPSFVAVVTCDPCLRPHRPRGSQGPGSRHSGGLSTVQGEGLAGGLRARGMAPRAGREAVDGHARLEHSRGQEAHRDHWRGKQ